MRVYKLCVYAVVAASWLAMVAPASAQTPPAGSIKGKVTLEAGGSPVHGAMVVVVGARRTALTGEDGTFEITNLAPGPYDVLAQREHFSAARQTVTVEAGKAVTVDFKLALEAIHEDVTVTGSATGAITVFDSFNAIISLDSFDMAKRLGATIADVLQDEPGIAKRSFGPGTTRPIIRGFDGDRVLIMQDGIRTGDLSSQSGDHGVSIDPAGLSRLEVIKGPATLLYGSNAIGGVVNAITPQDLFRSSPFTGTTGGVSVDAGSANAQGGFSGNIQHGTGKMFVYGGFTSRRTGDYDSPIGPIVNAGTKLFTGEGGAGWTGEHAYFTIGAGGEGNRYGVPNAGTLEGEEDLQIDLKLQRQTVRADLGWRNLSGSFADAVRFTVSGLNYQHDEIEIVDNEENLGTRFKNRVFTVRAEVEQRAGRTLNGRLGAEFFTRNYQAIGEEALAPETDHQSFSLFGYEEVKAGDNRVQFGGRFEHNGYTSEVSRSFNGFSGSLGLHMPFGHANAFVTNLTTSTRAPALEELFNFGPHPGNMAFEIGDPDLQVERSLGLEVSLRRRAGRATGELTGFYYGIRNFVFLDVTDEIEDGLHVANYMQGDSRFAGIEAAGHLAIKKSTIDVGLGYVSATLTDTGEALPRIPPFHGRAGVTLNFGAFSVNPDVTFYADQNRVFRDETTTPGWATFNVSASWQKGTAHGTHIITAQAYNLGDTLYRLHTSFLKDLTPEMGRGIRVTYGVRLF